MTTENAILTTNREFNKKNCKELSRKEYMLQPHKEKIIFNNLKKIIENKNILINILIKYYILFAISLLLFLSKSNCLDTQPNNSSFITIKIKEGENKIFEQKEPREWIHPQEVYTNFTYPNEIIINGIKQKNISNIYKFNEVINNVTLIWYEPIYNCRCMFYQCDAILEINLNHFDTSQVTDMASMFYSCSNFISLDLSFLDTSQVMNMDNMFSHCSSLKYLNLLGKFKTSKVTSMEDMFNFCSNLISLDLSNFDTSNVRSMFRMFCDCSSLISLDLSNFKVPENCDDSHIYRNCYSLISLNLFEKSKEYRADMFYDCYSLKYVNLEKTNLNLNSMTSDIFEYVKNDLLICIKWNNNSDEDNIYINCINYLNISKLYTCFQSKINKTFTHDIPITCDICGKNYYKLYNNSDNNSYIDCQQIINYEVENNKELNISYDLSEFEKIKEKLIQNTNKDNILEGKDIEIQLDENILITWTTTNNQKNNLNINKATINLDDCEIILKKKYNISINEPLYIFKLDKKEEGMKIPKIEYEIYYPLFKNDEMVKLNLTKCKNKRIEILNYVDINNENIDKYNQSSPFYNDICTTTDSNSKVDKTISDRQKEFLSKNLSLCEENCILIEYNYTIKKAKCKCLIKLSFSSIKDMKFEKEIFLKSFKNINNVFNIKIVKCYKNINSIDKLKKNYGFYIELFYLFLFLIILLMFAFKYYYILDKDIKQIAEAKIKLNKIKNNKNILNKAHLTETKKTRFNKNKPHIFTKENHESNNKKHNLGIRNDLSNISNTKIKFNKRSKKKKNKKNNINKLFLIDDNSLVKLKRNKRINTTKNSLSLNDSNTKNDNNLKGILIKKENKKYKDILKYNDYELNSLMYEQALIYDKRVFTSYYFSLLRKNNLLIFSFFNNNDYNSQIIKIFLFFLFFSVHFVVNTLFFNDNTMHKIYSDGGDYKFYYQIPQIFYSSLISSFINSLIRFLSLSERDIVGFKQDKNLENIDNKMKKLRDTLKIKFIFFFIFTFLLLLLIFYYICCFCGVYANTQIHLIKDSIISFGLSLVYPFGICLLPSIFRISSLDKKKNKKYLYIFSQFLAIL